MGESESISRAPSTSGSAKSCGKSKRELRTILGMVRTTVPKPHGKWLERVTGSAKRTTEYWLQGKHEPRGVDAMRIVRALRVELDERSRLLQQFELDLR